VKQEVVALVTGYKIKIKVDCDVTWATEVTYTGNTNTDYTDTSLTSNTRYVYRIFTFNELCDVTCVSSPSNELQNTTPYPVVTINAFKNDRTTIIANRKVRQENLTSFDVNELTLGIAVFTGMVNNQNFIVKTFEENTVVNKTINFNIQDDAIENIKTNIFPIS